MKLLERERSNWYQELIWVIYCGVNTITASPKIYIMEMKGTGICKELPMANNLGKHQVKQHDIGLRTASLLRLFRRGRKDNHCLLSTGPFSWQRLPHHSRGFSIFFFLRSPPSLLHKPHFGKCFSIARQYSQLPREKGKYMTKVILIKKFFFWHQNVSPNQQFILHYTQLMGFYNWQYILIFLITMM